MNKEIKHTHTYIYIYSYIRHLVSMVLLGPGAAETSRESRTACQAPKKKAKARAMKVVL